MVSSQVRFNLPQGALNLSLDPQSKNYPPPPSKKEKKNQNRKKKAICHLDHYPPSPTATVHRPESSYSLYSAVQESERLIRNLAETTHRGARPFNGESEAFTPQMEALARVNGSQASSPSFAYVRSQANKPPVQYTHAYSRVTPHPDVTRRALLQTSEPIRILGACSLLLTR